jgi:hypothetical protein
MGPEILIPLIASVAGTGMQMYASDRAGKEKQRAIDAMMAQRQKASNEIVADVEAEAPRYTQENMQRETGDVQAATEKRLVQDLQTALSPNTRDATIGKVSPEYLAKKAARTSEEASRNANLAKLFAAIDAPNQTRLKQSMDAADARARRQAIASGSNAYEANVGADIGKIHPNSTLTTVGGLINAGGQAYSSYSASEALKKAINQPKLFGS